MSKRPVKDSKVVPQGGRGAAKSSKHIASPVKAAKRANPAAASVTKPREIGIALALLKYFYWIELGIRSYLRTCNSNLEFSRTEGLVVASVMLGYSRPSDIARQLGVSRQAIHATIQQMRKKGIVDLVPDPRDGRINLVLLTKLARRMNDDGIVAMNLLWDELGRRLGKANLAKAAKVLRADWGPPMLFGTDGGDDTAGQP